MTKEKIKYYTDKLLKISFAKAVEKTLSFSWLDTKLGPMLAIADNKSLYLLEFPEKKNLDKEISRLQNSFNIQEGKTDPIILIEKELNKYFNGDLKEFKTPLVLFGTPFQKSVWKELIKIPYGQTISYLQLAKEVKNPKGFRAAANANGKNQLSIIIPCHRVINTNGKLGGYGGGIENKQWLLKHENQDWK
ncbi:MAG: methylated-DNA--[protein]-cysteine S-methyltransferase [Candidatus Babeliales bacterium]|nr:methylated-DNA--[protein]-cysteine S-methyltransferase [Candidatus Babeliales bacterium]